MIKIEFPADRADIALAIGQALTAIGTGTALANSPAPSTALPTEEGPFYWAHHESESLGCCDTALELADAISADALAEEITKAEYEKLKAQWTPKPQDDAAETTTGSVSEAQTAADASATSTVRLDEKGVPFDSEYCANAQKPFYGSGKEKGQWKKRQGVDKDKYDEWYAEQLLGAKIVEEPESDVVAATFGAKQAEPEPQDNAPKDVGQLMQWVSEKQAAGLITVEDVNQAYVTLGFQFDAIMNPDGDIPGNCAAIYHELNKKCQ